MNHRNAIPSLLLLASALAVVMAATSCSESARSSRDDAQRQTSASPSASTTRPTARASSPATRPTAAARRSSTTGPGQAQTEKEYLAQAAELREIYSRPASDWPKPVLDPGIAHREIGKLPEPEFPPDNPYSKEKDELGRTLFFDPRLSGSAQIACASCHDPDLAWADGRTVSFGHGRTVLKRNAPSVMFAGYVKPLFWDGRAATLEEQFKNPVTAADEMNAELATVEQRLNAIPEYRKQFKDVFGANRITMNDAAKAVATFQRSLANYAGRSKFDKFMSGQKDALSDSAIRGLHLFRTSARCMNCHNGPLFTDNDFHDLGFSYYGRKYQDLGRYEVTKNPKDVGRFRTPTLRDVERTKPYMHLGILSLEGTVNAYNMGMATLTPTTAQVGDPLFPKKDPLLKRLGLGSTEKADLIEFLKCLSEPLVRIRPPQLPGMAKASPSQIRSEAQPAKAE